MRSNTRGYVVVSDSVRTYLLPMWTQLCFVVHLFAHPNGSNAAFTTRSIFFKTERRFSQILAAHVREGVGVVYDMIEKAPACVPALVIFIFEPSSSSSLVGGTRREAGFRLVRGPHVAVISMVAPVSGQGGSFVEFHTSTLYCYS